MSDGDNKANLARALYKAQEVLAEAKKVEADLRKETIAAYFGENVTKGTHREDLSDKMELVMAQSATLSVDKDRFAEHKAHMESLGLIGDDQVIKLEPKASMTAYKYLSPEHKVMFDSVFKHGLSSPTVKFEVKKEAKK